MPKQMQYKIEQTLSDAAHKMESKLTGLPDKIEERIDLVIANIVKEIMVKVENASSQFDTGILGMSDTLTKTMDTKLENIVVDLETKIDGSLNKGLNVVNAKMESCCVLC